MGLTVVGISAYYHDSACALIQDGKLICAAEEERFSRIKHDASIPWQAFRFCLEEAKLTITDVDVMALHPDVSDL